LFPSGGTAGAADPPGTDRGVEERELVGVGTFEVCKISGSARKKRMVM